MRDWGMSSDRIIEVTIREGSNAKLDTFKSPTNDKKRLRNMFHIIKSKYGIDISNILKNGKDLNWAKGNQ